MGVAITMSKKVAKCLDSWRPRSDLWASGTVTADWRKDLIARLAKKGDLRVWKMAGDHFVVCCCKSVYQKNIRWW